MAETGHVRDQDVDDREKTPEQGIGLHPEVIVFLAECVKEMRRRDNEKGDN